MQPMAFLDIETSGLDLQVHEPIEVAWKIYDPEAEQPIQREFEVVLGIEFNEEAADPRALEINGWGKRRFPLPLHRHEAAERIERGLKGVTLVGNGIHFDAQFLEAFLARHGQSRSWNHRLVDLKDLAAGRLGVAPHLISTETLTRHFRLHDNAAHTALGDVLWNFELYKQLGLYERL